MKNPLLSRSSWGAADGEDVIGHHVFLFPAAEGNDAREVALKGYTNGVVIRFRPMIPAGNQEGSPLKFSFCKLASVRVHEYVIICCSFLPGFPVIVVPIIRISSGNWREGS